jgi:molybdate transport system substrate-binding protein
MKRILILIGVLVLVAAFFLLKGGLWARRSEKSGSPLGGGTSASAPTLLLFCGAGIRPAAEALIAAYEANYNAKIDVTYAGSGHLLGQISTLHKGDLFMPGEEFYVDRAIEGGLAEAQTKRIVAYFILLIFVQKGNPRGIRSLGDLAQPGLRVGFGDERSCAIGKQTLELLRRNRVPLDEVEKNVVYKSSTVDELGLAIRFGTVDATVIWDVTARYFEKDGTMVPIPPEQNIPAAIPVVVLKSTEHAEKAKHFIDFITSEAGKAIITEKGFSVTVPERSSPKSGQ